MKTSRALVALLWLTACSANPVSTSRDLASGPHAIQFVPGTRYESEVVPLLNSAAASIDVVQFNFDSSRGFVQTLANQLITLKHDKPALKIRVIMEKELFGAGPKNAATAALLKPKGIEVHLVTGLVRGTAEIGIEHGKLVLVDGTKILAGSTNWTNTSIQKNNETDLRIESPALGGKLAAYLDTLVGNSGIMHPGAAKDGNVTLYTDTAYFDALLAFLNRGGSGDRLDCSMYFFNAGDSTDPNDRAGAVIAALAAAKGRGVAVRLLLETMAGSFGAMIVSGNKNAAHDLFTKGVTQIYWDLPGKISHMKFCVLTEGGNRRVLLGSSNWNFLDLDENHQLNWEVENAGQVGDDLFGFFDQIVHSEGTAYHE